MANDDTFTREELAEYFQSSGYSRTAESTADRITAHIKSRREPVYDAGAMYVDNLDDYFYRTSSQEWILAETGKRYAHDVPMRPLRKLIPEG